MPDHSHLDTQTAVVEAARKLDQALGEHWIQGKEKGHAVVAAMELRAALALLEETEPVTLEALLMMLRQDDDWPGCAGVKRWDENRQKMVWRECGKCPWCLTEQIVDAWSSTSTAAENA